MYLVYQNGILFVLNCKRGSAFLKSSILCVYTCVFKFCVRHLCGNLCFGVMVHLCKGLWWMEKRNHIEFPIWFENTFIHSFSEGHFFSQKTSGTKAKPFNERCHKCNVKWVEGSPCVHVISHERIANNVHYVCGNRCVQRVNCSQCPFYLIAQQLELFENYSWALCNLARLARSWWYKT